MLSTFQKAVESQFNFAKRNGDAKLTIGGKTISALMIAPPTVEGDARRGRQRGTRRALVGVLKSDLKNTPVPGERAKLDSWNCVVDEEGIEEEAFTYQINLRSA
jgi:hypothetical protein